METDSSRDSSEGHEFWNACQRFDRINGILAACHGQDSGASCPLNDLISSIVKLGREGQ